MKSLGIRFWDCLASPEDELFFRVREPKSRRKKKCSPKRWHQKYRYSIHWCWQTTLGTCAWTPEIYQSISWPVTITRFVKVIGIEDDPHRQKKLLHFDFEVDARVRELSHCHNFFKRASKPPDLRSKGDSGHPLRSDLSAFCISCTNTPKMWPERETIPLQNAAEVYVKEVRT